MTAKGQADFDRAVEKFLDLLARAIAREHIRQSAERNKESGASAKAIGANTVVIDDKQA